MFTFLYCCRKKNAKNSSDNIYQERNDLIAKKKERDFKLSNALSKHNLKSKVD